MKWIQKGTLQYEAAEGIGVPHAFTTRLGGVSEGDLSSLNLSVSRGDTPENVEKNLKVLGHALGFSPRDLVMTHQTHTTIVRTVGEEDKGTGFYKPGFPDCDGLVTRTPGVALMIFTADCTPLLFWDPVTGAVGAAPAGWRGTAGDIGGKTVEAMVREFGCRREDIRGAVGPNIGPCCFETDRDVPDAMAAQLGPEAESAVRKAGEKYYVNLTEINARLLRRAGLQHVEVSTFCTSCRTDLFWSHRKMGKARGSQGAVILCREK